MKRPVRVMELRSTYRWGGGPDKTILNSAVQHDKKKLWILVVYLKGAWDNEFIIGDKARSMGLNYVEIVEKHAFDFSVLKSIVLLTRKYDIDVIHARDYKTNFYALIIKYLFNRKIKIVTMAHGWVGNGFKLKLYYTMDKVLASFFDRNFILFNAQVKQFIRKPNPKTTITVYNGIDYREWDPSQMSRGSFRKEINISEDVKLIGFVGRVMPEKDIITMVKVADEIINKRYLDVSFVIIGESKTQKDLDTVKNAVDKYNLSNKFLFIGKRSDIKQIYRDLDLFLMTSLQEGFPNSLLEAMAMKVPSVVSAVDGIPEILTSNQNGILVHPKDVQGFSDSIEKVLKNKKLSLFLTSNARKMVEIELSFKKRLRKMEDEYLKLIENRN